MAPGGRKKGARPPFKEARMAKAAARKQRAALSAAQLFDRAQQALALDDYQSARSALREAAALEPSNVELLEAYGSVLAELGEREQAVQMLRRAAELCPDKGFEKYMYLGQLLEGEEAHDAARHGIALLQRALVAAEASARDGPAAGVEGGEGAGGGEAAMGARELGVALCSALCSLAEMTLAGVAGEDLGAVAEEAEALLRRARDAHPSSPEPLQALASLRYEQGRQEEARELLRQSMTLWFRPPDDDGGAEPRSDEWEEVDREDLEEEQLPPARKPTTLSEEGHDEGMDGAASESDSESEDEGVEDDEPPSFEFRFECAKLLLELEDTTDLAVQVLEGLLSENDSVPDVWHLLALALYSGGAFDEAAEVCAHGTALVRRLRLDEEEEVVLALAEMAAAISEARCSGGEGTDKAGAGPQADQEEQMEEEEEEKEEEERQREQQREGAKQGSARKRRTAGARKR